MTHPFLNCLKDTIQINSKTKACAVMISKRSGAGA